MEPEVNFEELYAEALKQIEDFKLKQWADRQRTPIQEMVGVAYEWLTDNPLRLVTALAILYMTTATIHAHLNMFLEHRKNMRQ